LFSESDKSKFDVLRQTILRRERENQAHRPDGAGVQN